MFAKGDKVSVLDDNINGVVTKIVSNQVTIETDEGFEYWEDITDKWFEHISVNDQDDEI